MRIIIDIPEEEYDVYKSLKNGDITRPIMHIIEGTVVEETNGSVETEER